MGFGIYSQIGKFGRDGRIGNEPAVAGGFHRRSASYGGLDGGQEVMKDENDYGVCNSYTSIFDIGVRGDDRLPASPKAMPRQVGEFRQDPSSDPLDPMDPEDRIDRIDDRLRNIFCPPGLPTSMPRIYADLIMGYV